MSPRRTDSFMALFVRAQHTLGLGQGAIGELLGVSRSTVSRWYSQGGTVLTGNALRTLVSAVYPRDAALASEIAVVGGATLESLGLVAPPPPPPPPAPPVVVVAPLHPLVVDTVVCAAAEVVGQPPATLRPILIAAFERARAVGLSVEDVLVGLSPPKKEAAATRAR